MYNVRAYSSIPTFTAFNELLKNHRGENSSFIGTHIPVLFILSCRVTFPSDSFPLACLVRYICWLQKYGNTFMSSLFGEDFGFAGQSFFLIFFSQHLENVISFTS